MKGLSRTVQIVALILLEVNFYQPLFPQEGGNAKSSPKASQNMDQANSPAGEFANLRIPPLGQLIDAALEHSPLLDEQRSMIAIRQWQEKTAKGDWGRYILFYTDLRYGTVDLIVNNSGAISNGKSNSTWYNVGTRLQLSIFDALDMKRKNGAAREQVKYEESKLLELKRMINDDVIKLWNKLVSYKEIVRVNEDHIAVQQGNILYAEQQYKAGDIALVEYARIKEISVKADQEYELAKKELRETYLLLESLVGVKLTELINHPL